MPKELLGVVARFDSAAAELRKGEFPRPGTPTEWERMFKTRHARDHAKLLAVVVPLIEAFVAAPPSDRALVAAKLGPDALDILKIFTSYMPVLAVRRKSPALITQGLVALAIIGDNDDVRDQTFCLAALYHSAMKLGMDAPQVFRDVAALTPHAPLRDAMGWFPSRPPEARSLSAFGLRETLTEGEFDLVQNP